MNVIFATKDFHIQVPQLHIGENSPETNLMNVKFATKDFRNQATQRFIREHILERNLMSVMFATKCFCIQAAQCFIRKHTRETNLMNVIFVRRNFHNWAIQLGIQTFQSPFQALLWRASLPLWKGLLSLAARQISPEDVIVYIEGRTYSVPKRFTLSVIIVGV